MKRILIKMSGESLSNKDFNLAIDPKIVSNITSQLQEISRKGIQIVVVIGGGNIWRGSTSAKNGISRSKADYIGMLATVMNGISLQSFFEAHGLKAHVFSSLQVDQKVSESYVSERALEALENHEVVVIVGGTGRPFFTTDTAAALVASELRADLVLFAKNGVDGIYDSDPRKNKDAKRFEKMSYDEYLKSNLRVMDLTAVSMAKENKLKLVVFNISEENALLRAVEGKITNTIVE